MAVVLLSPHLDDAVLSCWHLLEQPGDLQVVNVFTASPPDGTPAPWWDRLTGAVDPVQRMRERRAEDERALNLTGHTGVPLDLLDGQYGGGERSIDALVDRLGTLLAPGTVVHVPAGLSGHQDHAFVRAAGLELARGGHRVLLYADLPHAITTGWPAWVSGEPEPAGVDVGADWAATLGNAGLIVERLVPRVRPLDARARARKLRALAEYRTQRAALDDMAFVPLDDPRALAFEVSWDVPASALGCLPEGGGDALVADAAGDPRRDGC